MIARRRGRAVVGALLLALGAVACGGGGDRAPAPTTTGARPASATVQAVDAPWKLPAPVAREVVVPNGKEFTVVGGLDATKFSTTAIMQVDPASGASRAAGTLTEAVHDAAGARKGDRILVFGGGGPSENGTADVQAVAADGTTKKVGALPGPRSDHVAARVGDTIYVFSGYDGAAIVPDIVSTTDGTAFANAGALSVPVRYPAIAVVGRAVYLFGGVRDSARGIDTPAIQRFDPATRKVETIAQLPSSLSHACAVVLGGQVYLLGGYVDNSRLSDRILRFDPATAAVTAAGTLPAPVSDAAAVVLDGRGYLVGGQGTDRAPRATVTVITASR